MSTGVVVSMSEAETWRAVDRRHRPTGADDLLVIGDRDQFIEAVYAAAVEPAARVRTV